MTPAAEEAVVRVASSMYRKDRCGMWQTHSPPRIFHWWLAGDAQVRLGSRSGELHGGAMSLGVAGYRARRDLRAARAAE
jgi:hypothetical protein